MFLGERQRQSPLRYPTQTQRSPQNDLTQTMFANNLYQQIIDKNKNNYLLNSSFSSTKNINNSREINNTTNSDDKNSSSYMSNLFNIQIASLESKNKANIEKYSTIENQNTNISTKLDEFNQFIQKLRSDVEKFSTFQMNSFLQPLSLKNKSNRKNIEIFSSNFNSSLSQYLNKNMNEFSTSLLIFNDKFLMFSKNLTKSDFPSLNREISKITNLVNNNLNQIDKLDNKLDNNIIKECAKTDKSIEDVNFKISQNFELFQNEINGQFISITNELLNILKSMSKDRQNAALTIQNQVEGIQNNSKNLLNQFQSSFKSFQNDNSHVLNDLKESIIKSLNISQDECSEMIVNLNNSYDQIFEATEKNFNIFQNEMTKTINCIREKNENEFTSMLNVIEIESQTQQSHFLEANDKISKFLFSLNDQLELNFKKCQQNANDNKERGIQYFQKLFEEKITPSLKPLKILENKLDYIEKRIIDCENSLSESITKMKANINQSNDKIKELTESLDSARQHQKSKLDLFDSNLRRIEVERNLLDNDQRLIPIDYIKKIDKKYTEELDKKVNEIENHFEQLIQFIKSLDPFDPNSIIYNDNKNININHNEISKNENKSNSNSESLSIENKSYKNSIDSENNSNSNQKEITTSQLYSDQEESFSDSNDESEEADETYSTNTLTENINKANQIINSKLNSTHQTPKNSPDNWDYFSNSEADDEETEEFTFSKSMNNSLKKT